MLCNLQVLRCNGIAAIVETSRGDMMKDDYSKFFESFASDIGIKVINPLSANPTKWSNAFKQIVWKCLTIMWDWRLKG